jgi:anti-sigma regulatory factor (Ser/Thr protein kinase)
VGVGGDASKGFERGAGDSAWALSSHVHRLEFVLHNARDVDAVARGILEQLSSLPGVTRVALGLVEGAGRRLRFIASESIDGDDALPWCHIDAFDDVPLNAVVRSGSPVLGNVDELEPRFPGLIRQQRELGTRAMATVPLPGLGAPMGGLVLYFDVEQDFGETQRNMLEGAARRTAEAVRRVRADALGTGPTGGGPALGDLGHHVALELEPDPRSAGLARRFLREHLTDWGIPDAVTDTAQLCVSELVNNVIMHAEASSELALHLQDDVLTVVLRDRGGSHGAKAPARPATVTDDDELVVAGRGLVLVDALTDRWGTERDGVGTTAWFVLELDEDLEDDGPAQTG